MTLNDLIEKQKINLACKELGCGINSKLYLAMHYAWENGMQTEEDYKGPDLSIAGNDEGFKENNRRADLIIAKWLPAMCNAEYIIESIDNEFDEAIRMTTDNYYREKHFQRYSEEIKPIIQEMSLRDVVFKTLKM